VRQALALRHRLAHFATSLQYYVHFEAMEAAWGAFTSRARAARDLDALIAAHDAYQVRSAVQGPWGFGGGGCRGCC